MSVKVRVCHQMGSVRVRYCCQMSYLKSLGFELCELQNCQEYVCA